MNRKVTVVGGAGNVGATVARSIANRELADVVIIDIADTKAQGIALDILQTCPVEGSDTRVVGGSDYAALGRVRRRRHHVRRAAQAGHEPRRPARGQLQDHAGRHGQRDEVLARRDHHRRGQPARRDGPGGLPPQRPAARARDRHGRRARLGPHARVHRDRAERVGRERPRVRARWPRRHDGAAAALLDGRRHPDHRAAVGRAHRGHLRSHRQRRRRDHQAGGHERLVCARAVVGARWSRPS